jgi:drug/metabolite transporter (DMT)-like permease
MQDPKPSGGPDWTSAGAVVLMALIWGYNWVALKQITTDASPFVMSAMRLAAASAALFVAAIVMRRPLASPPFWPTFAIGMFNTGLFAILQNTALLTGGAGKTAVLTYTMALWVVVMAPFMLGERITVPRALALTFGLAGIACLIAPLDMQHGLVSKGLALLTAIVAALGIIYTKVFRARHTFDTIAFTAWQTFYSVPALALLAVIVPGGFVHSSPHFWLLFTQVSVMGTGLAFLLFVVVITRLSASDAGLASLLTPALTVIIAWLVLGEQPTPIEGLGTLLILIGLAINSAPQRLVPWLVRAAGPSASSGNA